MKRVGFLAALLLLIAGAMVYWKAVPNGPGAMKRDEAGAAVPALTAPARIDPMPAATPSAPSVTSTDNSAPQTGKAQGASSTVATPHPATATSSAAQDAPRSAGIATDPPPAARADADLAKTLNLQFPDQLRDPDWALAAEQQLRRYLDSLDGDIQERLEVIGVECRKTLCQIRAASKYPGYTERDTRDWNETMLRMPLQQWWAQHQFQRPETLLSTMPQGTRTLLITYLQRIQAPEAGNK